MLRVLSRIKGLLCQTSTRGCPAQCLPDRPLPSTRTRRSCYHVPSTRNCLQRRPPRLATDQRANATVRMKSGDDTTCHQLHSRAICGLGGSCSAGLFSATPCSQRRRLSNWTTWDNMGAEKKAELPRRDSQPRHHRIRVDRRRRPMTPRRQNKHERGRGTPTTSVTVPYYTISHTTH